MSSTDKAEQRTDRSERAGKMSVRVGMNVRRVRASKGLSIRQMVERLDAVGFQISVSGLSKLETGYRAINVDQLAHLADGLGVDPAALLAAEPQTPAVGTEPAPETRGGFSTSGGTSNDSPTPWQRLSWRRWGPVNIDLARARALVAAEALSVTDRVRDPDRWRLDADTLITLIPDMLDEITHLRALAHTAHQATLTLGGKPVGTGLAYSLAVVPDVEPTQADFTLAPPAPNRETTR